MKIKTKYNFQSVVLYGIDTLHVDIWDWCYSIRISFYIVRNKHLHIFLVQKACFILFGFFLNILHWFSEFHLSLQFVQLFIFFSLKFCAFFFFFHLQMGFNNSDIQAVISLVWENIPYFLYNISYQLLPFHIIKKY